MALDRGLPHLLLLQMRILLGFFRTFPRGKKCGVPGRSVDQKDFCCDTVTKSVAHAVRTWKPGLSTSHWYLAATCSVFVLPDCCGGFFWELTSGFIPVFSANWFDNGYMCLSVYGGLGFAGCDALRAVLPLWFSGPDALHQGRYGPKGGLRRAVQKTVENPQLQFIKVVFLPVVVQRRILMVSQTIEIPQLLDKMSLLLGRAGSHVQVLDETVVLPQLQLVELWTGRCMPVVCNDRCRGRCPRAVSSTLVDVAVVPQRQVPAVGLDSWDEG